MIYVDYRAGSKELIKPLAKALNLDPADVETDLKYGDISFTGRGIGGAPLDIGIEYKKLGEMITCCRDGRFAGHQLPGLTGPKKMYDRAWLLVEGAWRADKNGLVATYKGPRIGWKAVPGSMSVSEYEKHLFTFIECGAIRLKETDTQESTVRFLVNLYHWWTDCDLDKHTSHIAVHEPAMFGLVSDFRQAVMRWPHVGLEFSRAVEEEFDGSIRKACKAPIQQWAEIAGKKRKLGFKAAESIDRFLDGEGA